MANWGRAEHKTSGFLKELDRDDLYAQLDTIRTYLGDLTRGLGKGKPIKKASTLMSSTDTDMRMGAGKRTSMSRDTDDLAAQVEAIRSDIQSLSATVGRSANKQIGRAQDKALETANDAEEAIKRNPLSAVAIAVGLGFVFGVFTRR